MVLVEARVNRMEFTYCIYFTFYIMQEEGITAHMMLCYIHVRGSKKNIKAREHTSFNREMRKKKVQQSIVIEKQTAGC